MMLQTLVENAIKHGLEPRTGGGTVWIRARRSDDGVVAVTVADDGDGFNAKTQRHRHRLEERARAPAPGVRRRGGARDRRQLPQPAWPRRSPCPTTPGTLAMAEPCPCTCVIAEDEALLRQALVDQLARAWPELKIVAECEDGASAVEAHRRAPARRRLPRHPHAGPDRPRRRRGCRQASPRTQIVFVTAYDQYADRRLRARRDRLPAQADRARAAGRDRAAPAGAHRTAATPRRWPRCSNACASACRAPAAPSR